VEVNLVLILYMISTDNRDEVLDFLKLLAGILGSLSNTHRSASFPVSMLPLSYSSHERMHRRWYALIASILVMPSLA